MRPFFFGFPALAAVTYLAYVLGAADSSTNSQPLLKEAPLPVAPRVYEHTRGGDLGEQHITPEKKAKKLHTRRDNGPVRGHSYGAQTKPSKDDLSEQPFLMGLHVEDNQADELAALGIKPRHGQVSPQQEKEKGFARRLSKGRILAKRWDKKVSGPHGHPALFGKKSDGTCSLSNTKLCERRELRDATITGVVVETERLVDEPSHPIEGHLKAGHYVEATPAVYVK
jgi:hypothetical protein